MLRLVNMEGTEKKYPAQLSRGQQKRVAIARSLVLKPSVLLLDEPFSALDAKIRAQMREELKRIQREAGLTVIFVTHDQEEALAISDRVAVMQKGRIEQLGTATQVYDAPVNRFVAGFIGEMNFIEQPDATLAVRPENLALTPAGGEGMARVTTIMQLGHYTQVLLACPDGRQLKAYVQREQLQGLAVGQAVDYRCLHAVRYGRQEQPAWQTGPTGRLEYRPRRKAGRAAMGSACRKQTHTGGRPKQDGRGNSGLPRAARKNRRNVV